MKFLSISLLFGITIASPLAKNAKANATCNAAQSKQVSDLAKGIQANLNIQKQELAGYATLG